MTDRAPLTENEVRYQNAALADENSRLRKGINDYLAGCYGFDFNGSKIVKCPHGRYRHEICEGCVDEHFAGVLRDVDGEGLIEKTERNKEG